MTHNPQLALFGVLGVLLTLLPAPAAGAHVGRVDPIAANFEARITGVRPPTDAITAKVVDGDGSLWMRADPHSTVLITGVQDEPLLRFDPRGVWVNLHSITAQSDKIDPAEVQPSLNPRARPAWRNLTHRHAYIWHEHRLHSLEILAKHGHASGTLGRWSVPLRIDDRRYALDGLLVYHEPGPAWPWYLLGLLLAAITTALGLRSWPLASRMAIPAAVLLVLAVWAVRLGRDLYGRPAVSADSWVDFGFTCLAGTLLLYMLLFRSEAGKLTATIFAGFAGFYECTKAFPVLNHSIALSELPAGVIRPILSMGIGIGIGLVVIALREPVRELRDGPPDSEAHAV